MTFWFNHTVPHDLPKINKQKNTKFSYFELLILDNHIFHVRQRIAEKQDGFPKYKIYIYKYI